MSQTRRSKKARKGDRSFQPSAAGKGAQDRTTDKEAFDRNYDAIDWQRPKLEPEPYENPYMQTAPDGTRFLGEAY